MNLATSHWKKVICEEVPTGARIQPVCTSCIESPHRILLYQFIFVPLDQTEPAENITFVVESVDRTFKLHHWCLLGLNSNAV